MSTELAGAVIELSRGDGENEKGLFLFWGLSNKEWALIKECTCQVTKLAEVEQLSVEVA